MTDRITAIQFRQLVADLVDDGTLTQQQGNAIRLRAGDTSWDDIATILGCSVRTARTHVDRASRKLLDAMTAFDA